MLQSGDECALSIAGWTWGIMKGLEEERSEFGGKEEKEESPKIRGRKISDSPWNNSEL